MFGVSDISRIVQSAITLAKAVFSFSGPVFLLLANIWTLFYEPLSFERITPSSKLHYLFQELSLSLPALTISETTSNLNLLLQPACSFSKIVDECFLGGLPTVFDLKCLIHLRRLLATAVAKGTHLARAGVYFPAFDFLQVFAHSYNGSMRDIPLDYIRVLTSLQDFNEGTCLKFLSKDDKTGQSLSFLVPEHSPSRMKLEDIRTKYPHLIDVLQVSQHSCAVCTSRVFSVRFDLPIPYNFVFI
jgi:hypothetical protein